MSIRKERKEGLAFQIFKMHCSQKSTQDIGCFLYASKPIYAVPALRG
jgi:hypothetical protein